MVMRPSEDAEWERLCLSYHPYVGILMSKIPYREIYILYDKVFWTLLKVPTPIYGQRIPLRGLIMDDTGSK